MTFSDKIKLLRKERKLDQKEASSGIDIAISSLRKYEQTNQKPDIAKLIKIKNFYNVSYDYLLDDNCTTRTANNLEIAKDLHITEDTVDGIRKIEKKEFLEDLLINKNTTKLLRLLEEKAQTNLILNSGIIICKNLYKTKNYNKPTDKMIKMLEVIVTYFKEERLRKEYWKFLIDNENCEGFISSIEYILDCWKNQQLVIEDDERLKFFNNEIFEIVNYRLNEYKRYCSDSLTQVIEEFCGNYIENKKLKL